MARLLPEREVVVAETSGDLAGPLHPEEAAAVAGAVDRRRREFTTGRVLARQGLARLGHLPVALVPDPDGVPRWPAGVVGSITHCEGHRAVAVAPAGAVLALGIDAEPDEALPDGVLAVVTSPDERRRAAQVRVVEHWSRLLFSAKESAYKAAFPQDRRRLAFEEVEVDLAPGGTFVARLRGGGRLRGRWVRDAGLLLTAVVVPVR